MLVFILFIGLVLYVQCDLACNGGNFNFFLNILVNGDCNVEFILEDVLEVLIICFGDKIFIIWDMMNSIIVFGINFVFFDLVFYEGQVLLVMVIDVIIGIFCNSFICVVDISFLVISCVNDIISCIVDILVVVFGVFVVSDNCLDDIFLFYFDNFINFICVNDNKVILEWVWSVVDEQGNIFFCFQFILLEWLDFNMDIEFLLDILFSCEVGDLILNMIGQLELFGIIIENINECDFNVIFNDDIFNFCGNIEYQIQCIWMVIEFCLGIMAIDLQLIIVVDIVVLDIICFGLIIVFINIGVCWVMVIFLLFMVVDNCDFDVIFFVSIFFGVVGVGLYNFVLVGIYMIQYFFIDFCGNFQFCIIILNVVDQELFIVVCEEIIVVSVFNNGQGIVFVVIFNDGSNDNCVQQFFFKVWCMMIGSCNGFNGDDLNILGYQEWFDDNVSFCCEEIDFIDIRVIMWVYEIDFGIGFVEFIWELFGGDFFGYFIECMVNVEVQDKIVLVVVCL